MEILRQTSLDSNVCYFCTEVGMCIAIKNHSISMVCASLWLHFLLHLLSDSSIIKRESCQNIYRTEH